jgi:hypothetical protein
VNEIDQIRRQMAEIRRDLHEDVSGVVSGVAEAMDVRSLLQRHPWTSVGAALLTGYLIVPRRTSLSGQPAPLLSQTDPAANGKPARGLASRAVGLLWPIAEQAVQSYALVWINGQIKRYLAQNHAGPPPADSEPGPFERRREVNFYPGGGNDR